MSERAPSETSRTLDHSPRDPEEHSEGERPAERPDEHEDSERGADVGPDGYWPTNDYY